MAIAVLRAILGIAIGVMFGLAVVMAGDWLNTRLFPIPDSVNVTDPRALGDYLASAPLQALIGLPLTWTVAAALGAFAAAKIGARLWAGWTAGTILFAGTLLNLAFIPHPWWMLVAAVIAVPLAVGVGSRAGAK